MQTCMGAPTVYCAILFLRVLLRAPFLSDMERRRSRHGRSSPRHLEGDRKVFHVCEVFRVPLLGGRLIEYRVAIAYRYRPV